MLTENVEHYIEEKGEMFAEGAQGAGDAAAEMGELMMENERGA